MNGNSGTTTSKKFDRAQVFTQLAVFIAELTNFQAEEIQLTDHLVDDLYLIPPQHLPKIMNMFAETYGIEIEPELIEDFITEIEDDPDKGTVEEFLAVIMEELEFN
jgi:hypothetical protein